jgi:hypothetical protein
MRDDQRRRRQKLIMAELGMRAEFDARAEIVHRVEFLVAQLSKRVGRQTLAAWRCGWQASHWSRSLRPVTSPT